MNFEQIVLMFEEGFHQVVNQIRVQRLLADHHVPNTDGRNRFVNSPVNTAGQIDGRIFLVGGLDFFLLGSG